MCVLYALSFCLHRGTANPNPSSGLRATTAVICYVVGLKSKSADNFSLISDH